MNTKQLLLCITMALVTNKAETMEQDITAKKKHLVQLKKQNKNIETELQTYKTATESLYVKVDSKTLQQLFTDIYAIPTLGKPESLTQLQKKILELNEQTPKLEQEKKELETRKKELQQTIAAESPELIKNYLQRNIQLFIETVQLLLGETYYVTYRRQEKNRAEKQSLFQANSNRLQYIMNLFKQNTQINRLITTQFRNLAQKTKPELTTLYNTIKSLEAKTAYIKRTKRSSKFGATSFSYRFQP